MDQSSIGLVSPSSSVPPMPLALTPATSTPFASSGFSVILFSAPTCWAACNHPLHFTCFCGGCISCNDRTCKAVTASHTLYCDRRPGWSGWILDGNCKNGVLSDSVTPFLLFELHFFLCDKSFVIKLKIIWSGTDLWVQMTARGTKLPPQGIVHPLVFLAHWGCHSLQSLLKVVDVNQWDVTEWWCPRRHILLHSHCLISTTAITNAFQLTMG